MTSSPLPSKEVTEDFIALPVELTALEPAQITQIQQLSQVAVNEAQQWQIYLNALGLFGFEQWLADRSTLSVDHQACSLFQPGYAALIPVATQVTVGAFRICVIAVEGTPEQIELPRAVVELPEFMAHFYVVAEVWEELQMVTIWGFMRYDQLTALQQRGNLQTNADWTVTIPLSEFEPETDRLLLHLRCLDPAILRLPEVNQQPLQLPADLMVRLSNWQPARTPLWQILDWQQGASLLRCPELVHWLVQPRSAQWQEQLANRFQFFAQPAINVGYWLKDELDSIAQTLNWVLLPSLAQSGFRSLVESADLIMTQLDRLNIAIPPTARSGYQEFNLGELNLRLYVVTWPEIAPERTSEKTSERTSEWSLVVILTAQPEHHLPSGLQLRVSDLTGVLTERTHAQFIPDAHLYARVVGDWQEKFWVTITHQDTSLTLPPFTFAPNA